MIFFNCQVSGTVIINRLHLSADAAAKINYQPYLLQIQPDKRIFIELMRRLCAVSNSHMYHFSYFKETDRARLLQFFSDYPFAFLTGSFNSGKQVATQIPVLTELRDGELYLQGHMMRNTDHHKAFAENPQALLVFTGPHAYVSASWYSNPQTGSTWNYMSIHIAGELQFLSDDALVAFMKRMTLHFEQNDPASPTLFDNLPQAFLSKMMPAIVGFEIRVSSIENVFKLSQNRDEKSYLNIIAQLESLGGNSALVAAEMKKRKEEVFPPGAQWDAGKFDS